MSSTEVARTPIRSALSRFVGWAADRRVPRFLRKPIYGAFARRFGLDLSEARLPLEAFPSFGAFFVRQLVPGARPADPDPEVVVSPVDGRVQAIDRIEEGCVLQAKGRSYPLEQLLGGAGESHDLEGGTAWTVYLSPADYHRIHAPDDVRIEDLRWIAGARYSVAPKVLARRTVLPVNERVVLRLSSARGPLFLVLVGATNVGRIRVVGVEPGRPAPSPGRDFARGEELARFEMGSTIVLVSPLGGASALPELLPGQTVRLGQALGRVAGVPQTA